MASVASPLLLTTSPARRAGFSQDISEKLFTQSPTRSTLMGLRRHAAYSTNFRGLLASGELAAPPGLLKYSTRKEHGGPGKVKILLRVAGPLERTGSSWMAVDQRRKQVNVLDPSMASSGSRTRSNSALPLAPKMFNFDSVFSPDSSQSEIAATSLLELVHAVASGVDGCFISYGHAKLGKTYTVVGCDTSVHHAGVIPSAVSWLFKLIEEEKERSGARFTVRISAVEVSGTRETVTDLLAEQANGYGRKFSCDDPKFSSPLLSPNELLANSVEHAGQWLDAAMTARRSSANSSSSHMFFTLHIHQFRPEKSGSGGVSGVRSRLHFIDLGSQAGEMSVSALGNVLMSLINGEKCIPHKESKLTQLLKNALSNVTGQTTLLCHVSPQEENYSETLSVLKMASRVHRIRRRKIRTGVGYSSADSSRLLTSTGSSELSSSEISSATTVIFCGNGSPPMDGDQRKRIQTNPKLKLLRLPPGSPKLSPGAPQSYLSLSHNSPSRTMKPMDDVVDEMIHPIVRPQLAASPKLSPKLSVAQSRPLVSKQEMLSPLATPVRQASVRERSPGRTLTSLRLQESIKTPQRVSQEVQVKRTPLLGRRVWNEDAIDPLKREMIQKWVELQSPEEEKQDLLGGLNSANSISRKLDLTISDFCDASQQVSQLEILHDTNEFCDSAPTAESNRSADMPGKNYGISQRDLDDLEALETLASHLSSQLDLLSVEHADSFTEDDPPVISLLELPEPMKPLGTMNRDPVWERIGTFPRNQQIKDLEFKSSSAQNTLRRKTKPNPPSRSSSITRGDWTTTSRTKRTTTRPPKAAFSSPSRTLKKFGTTSPELSQDSSQDSGFSISSANTKLTRIQQLSFADKPSKRSPSQSSSGLGSDLLSCVSSNHPSPKVVVTSLSKSLESSPISKYSSPKSQSLCVAEMEKENGQQLPSPKASPKTRLWTRIPCLSGNME